MLDLRELEGVKFDGLKEILWDLCAEIGIPTHLWFLWGKQR